MEIKRGYVVWSDENGRHKEPLYKHPDMLESATDEQRAQAEELKTMIHEEESSDSESSDSKSSKDPFPRTAAQEQGGDQLDSEDLND